jgi:hypothetical protein
MMNKPVAWMSQGGDVSRSADYFEEIGFKDLIPLYTYPVEITDEEIDNCAYRTGMWCDGTPDAWDNEAIRNFARAILKL